MIQDIGGKVKILAWILFGAGVIGSCMFGGLLKSTVFIFIGCFVSIITTVALYGFGELICINAAMYDQMNELLEDVDELKKEIKKKSE